MALTVTQPEGVSIPAFVIKELTGRRRELRLTERALPRRPFTLEGTQQIEATYYPGNPVATSTILGAREGSTTVNGYWKDRFIQGAVSVTQANALATTRPGSASLNGNAIDTVENLVDLVDDIRMSGSLLDVQWGTRTRRGHIAKFTQNWHNTNDVEWEIEFTWISKGQVVTAPRVASDDASGMSRRTRANVDEFVDVTSALPTTPQSDWYDRVQDLLGNLTGYVTQFEGAVSQTYNQALRPFDMLRSSASTLSSVIVDATTAYDILQSTPPEQLFNTALDGLPDSVNQFSRMLVGISYVTSAQAAARQTIEDATIDRDTLLKLLTSDVEKAYVAVANDDLLVISQKFYNTPDQWRKIMLYNSLRTPEVSVGQLIFIPLQDVESH